MYLRVSDQTNQRGALVRMPSTPGSISLTVSGKGFINTLLCSLGKIIRHFCLNHLLGDGVSSPGKCLPHPSWLTVC